MPKSMTGCGRFEYVSQTRKITAEIKSVNHRYTDINIKMPRQYSFLEDVIRQNVLQSISRGKIDVFITVEHFGKSDCVIRVDEGVLQQYTDAIAKISEITGKSGDVSAIQLARLSDVLIMEKAEEDQEIIKAELLEALSGAVEQFIFSRSREGERIADFLKNQAKYIAELVAKVEVLMPQTVENYRNRLTEKVRELLGDNTIDETRILTETAIFADKICTDEEVVRLKSHLTELPTLLDSDAPSGRRLDFLIQEMNRETNTIGSKANDLEISKIVVELKSEIEKLREQVQNIE